MVVRFLFQPVEEVLYSTFSKLGSSREGDSVGASKKVLETVLHLMVTIGLVFGCFGPAYSWIVIHIVYTSKYSSTAAPTVMAWYCFYILLLAVNGMSPFFSLSHHLTKFFNLMNNNMNNDDTHTHIKGTTEAFMHSVGSESTLRRLNLVLIGFSVLFVSSATLLLRIPGLSTVGLVVANIMSILLQTASLLFLNELVNQFFLISNSKLRHGTSDWIQFMVYQEPLQRTWLISEFFENSTISTRFNHTCCIVRNNSLNQ